MDFVVGQRVALLAKAGLCKAVMVMHAGDGATVLRRSDRTDAVYGMYWLTGQHLAASADNPCGAGAA